MLTLTLKKEKMQKMNLKKKFFKLREKNQCQISQKC